MRAERLFALLPLVLLPLSFAICGEKPAATVSFTLDFPGSNPSHYEIVVGNDGNGSYTSNGKLDENSDPFDPPTLQFQVDDSVRSQVFDLAKRAHYFSGKVDSGRKNIANTGTKVLAYKDASHDSKATYNYSLVQPVDQLTEIFQGLSTTLECGRRLTYLHKYEKLALDDELKRMAELQQENSLVDIQAIAPELKAIADDSTVINVSRSRALRLLATSEK
ncbi:MAG TPA: hypothetical protein VLW06_01355 [Terriglobales bacterium]|nr:hypothetical protein [Terriglobales bacterium]